MKPRKKQTTAPRKELNPRVAAPSRQKWAWHRRTLLALRGQLLHEQSGLAETARERLESFSQDMADAASDEFDHELTASLLSAKHDALYEIDAALARMTDGTYGICEATGRPIPSARLKAIPWTRFTLEVEAELERNGKVGRPKLGQLGSTRSVPAKFPKLKTAAQADEPAGN